LLLRQRDAAKQKKNAGCQKEDASNLQSFDTVHIDPLLS
jgi:hypothetical protein